MFNKKVQTVGSVSEFTSGAYKFKKVERKVNKKLVKWGMRVAVTVVAGSFLLDISAPMAMVNAAPVEAIPVNSPVSDALGSAVNNALQPLIDVLKELAKPIAGAMITWNCLRFMIGQKEPAITGIQHTAVGYLLVMLSPIIIDLITGVGGAITH